MNTELKAELASQLINGKTVATTTTATFISFFDPFVAFVYVGGFFSGVGVTVLISCIKKKYERNT